MAVPPHGYLPYNKMIPARRRNGAAVCGARGRPGIREAARRARRERQRRRCVGRQRRHAGRALTVHRSGRVPARQGRGPERGDERLHRPARSHHAPRRAHGRRAARARRRCERSAPDLDADAPLVGRLQLRAGTGRRHAVLAGRAVHPAGRDAAAREARSRPAVRPPRRARRRGHAARRSCTGKTPPRR